MKKPEKVDPEKMLKASWRRFCKKLNPNAFIPAYLFRMGYVFGYNARRRLEGSARQWYDQQHGCARARTRRVTKPHPGVWCGDHSEY